MSIPSTPSFRGLASASPRATAAARASSLKRGTRCEKDLQKALRHLGIRYSLRNAGLPGLPDLVFRKQRIVVFCDGDYWHGRGLEARISRLATGHNASYWMRKLEANVERDARNSAALENLGWKVLRYWETDIRRSPLKIANSIARFLARSDNLEQRRARRPCAS